MIGFALRISVVAATASAALATPGAAQAGGGEVQARFSTQHVGSRGLDAILDGDLVPLGGLAVAYRADPVGPVAISIGLAYDAGTRFGTMFNRVSTELEIDRLTVGGSAHYEVFPRLRVHGQLSFGSQWATLRLRDSASPAADIEDGDRSLVAQADAGFDVELAGGHGSRHSLSLRLEMGYLVATAATLRSTSSERGDLRIATSAAPLGAIKLSGAIIRVGLGWRF